MQIFEIMREEKESLPSWERGLKCPIILIFVRCTDVAPLVGAWIEMYLNGNEDQPELVAPLVGAWIEILLPCSRESILQCRSPRGSVD